MRVPHSILLAILVLFCQALTCAAQDKPAGKTDAPQTLTGPSGSDRPAASGDKGGKSAESSKSADTPGGNAGPKTGGPVPAKGRVGTLSPDEARRAARARDRASSAAKPAPKRDAKSSETTASGAVPRPSRAAQPTDRPAVAAPAGKDRTADGPRLSSKRVSRRTAPLPQVQAGRRWNAPPYAGNRIAADRRRGPRVGDLVPPGARLYPLPPPYARGPLPPPYARGLGYETAAAPYPLYMRRMPAPGYPPYPRYRDFDDYEEDD